MSNFNGAVSLKGVTTADKDVNLVDGANLNVAGKTSANGGLNVLNGAQINGGLNMSGGKITNVGDGIVSSTSKDAVNGSQLNATNANVTALTARVAVVEGKTQNITATSGQTNVSGQLNTNGINNSNQKITSVANGAVASASTDAVNGSQLFTEQEARIAGDAALGAAIGATNERITTEVKRLDGRIDTESAERKAEDVALHGRIDTEAKTRADADIALNKRIDVESTERKADVHNLNNRVDQEVVDRIEGDRQTLEEANSHTNNQVANERDRALAAEAGLNRHINGLGAMTMAANAVAHTANPGDKKTSVGVGLGSYGGETAIAIGATHTRHIEMEVDGKKKPMMVRYGATLSKSRASRTGFGVGASFSF